MDFANITNIFVTCGLIHGAPQRQDSGSNLIFDSGSKWSQPLYTCASAVKATIKTVSFSYNGTDASLEDLSVTGIQDKVYSDGQALPLWGVENTGNKYYMNDLVLVWGLISDEYANHENVSTVRQESLYLPGYSIDATLSTIGFDNMPGAEAFLNAMAPAYLVNAGNSLLTVDYSGATDISMWVRWQELSKSAESVSLIPNLIFADTAASAVVGTKGVLGPGNTATANIVPIQVTPTVSRIKYHWPYGIPAFIAALILLIITIVAIITVLFGHNSIARLRLHLQRSSTGRIFTTFLFPEEPHGMTMKSGEWAKVAGKTIIDLSGECPIAAAAVEVPEEPFGVSDNKQSASNHHSEEVQEEGVEHGREFQDEHGDGQGAAQRFLGDRNVR
jgi:hypothetical protein